MPCELFYFDPVTGLHIDYARLERDVDSLSSPPEVHVFRDCYALFTTLLRAVDEHKPVMLLDNEEQGEQINRLAVNSLCISNIASSDLGVDARQIGRIRKVAPQDKRTEQVGGHSYRWDLRSLKSSTCQIGLCTSGTTGQPKLIMHTLAALTRNVQVAPHHRTDRWGLAYHPTRFAGLQVFLQALANRNPLIRLYGLSPSAMNATIDEQRLTHLSATPTLLRLLVSDSASHPHVERVTLGGEVADRQLLQALKTTFPQAKVRNIYASTEVGALLSSDGDSFQVPESLRSMIQVVDGELIVHRQLLASSLQARSQDDFYRTGDCVELMHEQPLTFRFTARRSDIINVGGYKVNPLEVESLLTDMPEVAEATVYGRSNSVTGSLVCCDVVLSTGKHLTTQQIIARLKPIVPAYKIPRIINFVEQLCLTSTGKRQRGI